MRCVASDSCPIALFFSLLCLAAFNYTHYSSIDIEAPIHTEMADKPSRALVLYGDGLARFVDPAQTHLHYFASRASCGFLALPDSLASETEDSRIVREFAELLDANEAYKNSDVQQGGEDKSQGKCSLPTIAQRFMGMKAALLTDNLTLKSFSSTLGIKVLNWNELENKSHSVPDLASELLKLLGLQEGKISETSEFDLVFVHVESGKEMNSLKGIELVNHLVGDLLQMAHSESDIGSHLHTSVILSYGATLGDDHLQFPLSKGKPGNYSELSSVFPSQSYMIKAGKQRENIRQHSPMLLAQYQKAVTRKDMVESFSFSDFTENSGSLVIPADRFIHEVAFKLWKAPKYGA